MTNYLYGKDLITDSLYDSLLNEREREELSSREDPVYYFNVQNRDSENYYSSKNRLEVYQNDAIDYRYEIQYRLGKGVFGSVYLCNDHKYKKNVAMKIIRHEKRFHRQAKREIELYDTMSTSEDYSPNVICMLKAFIFREDIFIIFPNFGINLFEYYKNHIIGARDLKSFSKQIAKGLEFIHSFDIIHLDLKPENILIENKEIKIIDLGSSVFGSSTLVKDYAQSRYYRSPDIVFKLNTTVKTDVWSYGCILYELAMREPIIRASNHRDLVIYYVHIMGYPPKEIDCYYVNSLYFTRRSRELLSFCTKKDKFLYPNDFQWCELINKDLRSLIMDCCLVWQPEKRATMTEILSHPFLLE